MSQCACSCILTNTGVTCRKYCAHTSCAESGLSPLTVVKDVSIDMLLESCEFCWANLDMHLESASIMVVALHALPIIDHV